MNSYFGSGGSTDPGFGTFCKNKGKETQYHAGEYPPATATSQTWVDESAKGWIWGWVEFG